MVLRLFASICFYSLSISVRALALKVYRGSRGIVLPILNLGEDGGEWLTSRIGSITAEKEPRYPLNGMLGQAHSRSGRFGEDENILLLPEFQLVAKGL